MFDVAYNLPDINEKLNIQISQGSAATHLR